MNLYFTRFPFSLLLLLSFPMWSMAQCTCNATTGASPGLELYWVGNSSNNYNDRCNWRLNSITSTQVPCQAPRSSDNVYFMAAAFTGTSHTITIDQNSNCHNMTWDDNITSAQNVRLTGATLAVQLDIYGNLDIATHLNINGFKGFLRFTATQPGVVTFRSRNKEWLLNTLEIALSGGAELQLLDDLTVENRFANSRIRDQGRILLSSGHFNTNGQTVRADYFESNNNNSTRQLTLDNSTFAVDGGNAGNDGASSWYINFNATNNAGFSATGSHVKLIGNGGGGYQGYRFGRAITYDSITIDKTISRHYLDAGTDINCHYLRLAQGLAALIGRNARFRSDHCIIEQGVFVVGIRLTTDNFVGPNNCDMATVHSCVLTKKTPGGNLAINNIIAYNIDGVGGSTYSATQCYQGPSCTNITFAPITTCNAPLRYVGTAAGDQDNWQNVANWVNHNTGNPATHIPTPWTDVYFDANSFPTRNYVTLNAPAMVNDMRWNGIPANADLRLTHHLYLMGTLELDANMAPISEGRIGHQYGRSIICMSPNNDSLITRGVYVNSGFQFPDFSRYQIVDTLYSSMLYQHGNSSNLTFNNTHLNIRNYLIYRNSTWNNSTVNYLAGGWTGVGSGGTQTFNNSTFYFNNTGTVMVSAHMPNVVVNGPGRIYSHSYFHAHGDLTINASVMSSMKTTFNYRSLGRIVVDSNMILAPGVDVLVNGNTNNYVRVGKNVLTSGNCSSSMTSIRSDGNPIEFTVNGTSSILQGVFLQGLNASLGQPLVATNSTDGGNNTNITFAIGTGQTFYWTGTPVNPNDLNGNWSNPDHWTVIPGKTTGDGTCIPSITDSVVFNRGGNCLVDINAYCKSLDGQVPFTLRGGDIRNLYIAGSWSNVAGMTNHYYGVLNFVGSGSIQTNGVDFQCRELSFNKIGGYWTLQSNLRLNRPTISVYHNNMKLAAGTLDANGYDIYVRSQFISNTTNPRALELQNSTFQIGANANYNILVRTPWNTNNSANMTINGGLIHIMPGRANVYKRLYFGNGNLQYDHVLLETNTYEMEVRGSANFHNAEWNANLRIFDNNNYDTLALNGGYTYRFQTGRTQTLNAPHGNIRSRNVGPGRFINIETTSTGQLAYIHKEYGNTFCLSYIKVKDVRATKAATQPAACTLPDCWALLEFQTDQNSDSISISNNDWGVWRFKLTPLINPTSSGADTVVICKTGNHLSYPIQILGTSPYIIDYTWRDATNAATNGGQSGIVVYDNDNDPTTPYIYNVPLNPIVSQFDYTVDIATSRCGDRILSTPVNTHVIVPTPQPLVQSNRSGSCTFENEGNWYSIIDQVDERPIVSLLDSVGPTDNDSLGLVNVNVFFEPTVQTLTFNGDVYPYLQRHWQVTPTHNRPGKVRLYFTQAELTALGAGSFAQTYNGGINPATEIMVLKYNDGTFPTATTAPNVVMVPHSVVAADAAGWAALPAARAPFSTTNGVIAIEFDVTSFSHFAIVLTQSALLNTPNLTRFDAQPFNESQALTEWSFENMGQVANFTVQHTTDFSDLTDQITRTPEMGQLNYEWVHETPKLGTNYYRLRTTNHLGEITYSAWKHVDIRVSRFAKIFPNPTSQLLYVQLYAEDEADLIWEVYNTVGQVVLSGTRAVQTGMQTFEVPTQGLTNGMYRLRLTNQRSGYVQQHSFIKR